jgi:hypothetical protein
MDNEEAKEIWVEEEKLKVKEKASRAAAQAASKDGDAVEGPGQEGSKKFDVLSLFDKEIPEPRSEVVSIRIKPSTRKKLKKILGNKISEGRKLTEASLIAEILEKIL